MADAIRPGGVYQVSGQWVDANGRPADAPGRAERKAHDEDLAETDAQIEAAAQQAEATRRRAKNGGEG